jgi:hypothetical protein
LHRLFTGADMTVINTAIHLFPMEAQNHDNTSTRQNPKNTIMLTMHANKIRTGITPIVSTILKTIYIVG